MVEAGRSRLAHTGASRFDCEVGTRARCGSMLGLPTGARPGRRQSCGAALGQMITDIPCRILTSLSITGTPRTPRPAARSARHLIPPQSKTAKRPASSMCTHPRMPRDAAHLPARNRVPTLDTSHDRCHPLCMCDRAGTHLTVPSGNAEVFHTSPSQLAMRRVHNTTQRPAAGSAIGAHYLFHVDHPVHRRALFGPRLRSTRLHQQQLASTLCHRLRGQGSNRHSLPPRPHSDALSAAGGVSVVQER